MEKAAEMTLAENAHRARMSLIERRHPGDPIFAWQSDRPCCEPPISVEEAAELYSRHAAHFKAWTGLDIATYKPQPEMAISEVEAIVIMDRLLSISIRSTEECSVAREGCSVARKLLGAIPKRVQDAYAKYRLAKHAGILRTKANERDYGDMERTGSSHG
jgi:hypothetical protein